jgi:hypothetical protein
MATERGLPAGLIALLHPRTATDLCGFVMSNAGMACAP